MRLDCGGMEFEKLADLLELGQFELIGLPEGEAGKIPSDIRLVYMMNDTAESFLVFHEAVMTGTYLPEYEGYDEKQLARMTHLERMDYDPDTGVREPCWILFDYRSRDVLTYDAKMVKLSLVDIMQK